MSPTELRDACERANDTDEGRLGMIVLKLSGRKNPGEHVRLAGRRGPLGRVVGTMEDGTVLADFRANEILRWLDKHEETP